MIWHENAGAVQPKVGPANMLIQGQFFKVWRVENAAIFSTVLKGWNRAFLGWQRRRQTGGRVRASAPSGGRQTRSGRQQVPGQVVGGLVVRDRLRQTIQRVSPEFHAIDVGAQALNGLPQSLFRRLFR